MEKLTLCKGSSPNFADNIKRIYANKLTSIPSWNTTK